MSSYYGPVPEPDPGQPYNKYHWVKSAMQKLQSGCLKGTPLNEGSVNNNNCLTPVRQLIPGTLLCLSSTETCLFPSK